MNRLHIIFTVLSFYALATVCYSQPIVSGDKLPVLDKTKSYPEKKLEFETELSYIPLETSEKVLFGEFCELTYVSDDRVVVADEIRGDVFIFDINGKLHSKFNQKGGKGYVFVSFLAYAENEKEVFVLDKITKKIFVFTEDGNQLRSFKTPPETHVMKIYNFDKNTLLCFNENQFGSSEPTKPYFFISKETGEITEYIDIEVESVNQCYFVEQKSKNTSRGYSFRRNFPENCKFGDNFILANRSMDTVYLLKKDKSLTPLFTQTPTVHSEHPTAAFIGMIIHNRFLKICVSSYDYKEGLKILKSGGRWRPESIYYIFDMKTGEFFKEPTKPYKKSEHTVRHIDISENTYAGLRQPWQIIDSYKKGRLKDDKLLLELAPKLNLEDNPVLEIEKFR
ncbi:6-bladed beta-propeller [Puteibacter caeruleilacunae]|nr:6-bladed beta-propeller [Puteibacter caeruleilacunae]